MAGFTHEIFMRAHCHGLLDLQVTVLARCLAFDMPHASRPVLMAFRALDLLRNMHILGQARRLGEVFAEIAVPSSSLHRSRMTNKGAPAPAGAIRRRRYAFECMHPLLARGRIVAIKTTHMANIACLLLGDRLFMRKREIDLLNDPFCVFEGEPVSFRPADRLGVREGRPSIIRAVNIVPDAHGALTEI